MANQLSVLTHKKSRALAASVLSIVWMLLLEIPILSALAVLATFGIMIITGSLLLHTAGWKSTGIGVGFVTALGVLTFSGQALIILGVNPSVTYFAIVIAMLGMILAAKLRGVKFESLFDYSNHHEVLFALGIAMIAFAARHPWLLPFAISVAIAERIPFHRYTSRYRLESVAVLVTVGAVASRILRPLNWWNFYLNGDANKMESESWSTAHWSVLEQPGNLGQAQTAYHWLGMNFFGILSHLAVLDPWKAMMNIGVPAITVILASLLIEPARKITDRPNSAQWILVLTVVVGMGWYRIESFNFGILSGLTVLAILLKEPDPESRPLLRFASWCLLFATLTFSKTTASLTLAMALSVFVAYQFARKKYLPWIPLIACLLTNLILYVFVFRHSIYSESVLTRLDFSREAMPEIIDNTILFVVTSVLLPIATMAVLVKQASTPRFSRTTDLLLIFTLGLVLSVGAGLLGFVYHQRVGTPLLVLITALCTWKLITAFESYSPQSLITKVRRAQWAFGLMAIFLLAFTFPVLINRLAVHFKTNSNDVVSNLIVRSIRELSLWLILTLVVTAVLLKSRRNVRTGVAVALTAVTLAVALGNQLDESRRVLAWGTSVYYNWPANDSPFPNADLTNVGKYVRSNTPSDAILASNNFCCFGNRWWQNIIGQIEASGEDSLAFQSLNASWVEELPIEQQAHVATILWGGDNYQTLAVTRRRFLMQGLSFQRGIYDRPTPEQLKRMSLSLDFANSPSSESLATLKSYGVSGFIVNLDLTAIRDWEPYASEKFRDGRFVYLELR